MKHKDSIIKSVTLSEKAAGLTEKQNQYFLEVDLAANKLEIKKAVQDMFNVTVLSVNTLRRDGGVKVLRNRRTVKVSDWKRAIVTLKEGDRIDIL